MLSAQCLPLHISLVYCRRKYQFDRHFNNFPVLCSYCVVFHCQLQSLAWNLGPRNIRLSVGLAPLISGHKTHINRGWPINYKLWLSTGKGCAGGAGSREVQGGAEQQFHKISSRVRRLRHSSRRMHGTVRWLPVLTNFFFFCCSSPFKARLRDKQPKVVQK